MVRFEASLAARLGGRPSSAVSFSAGCARRKLVGGPRAHRTRGKSPKLEL